MTKKQIDQLEAILWTVRRIDDKTPERRPLHERIGLPPMRPIIWMTIFGSLGSAVTLALQELLR